MLRDGKGVVVCAKAEEKDAVDATVTMLFVVVVVVVVVVRLFIVVIFETEVVVALLAAMEKRRFDFSDIFCALFYEHTIDEKKRDARPLKNNTYNTLLLSFTKEECF